MTHLNINSINAINNQIVPEIKKRWKEVTEKYDRERENRKIEPGSFLVDSSGKNKSSITDEKMQELFNTIDSLSENERKYFFRQPDMRYDRSNLGIYENPVTFIKDIKDLQNSLAQILIEFVTDRNPTDIDESHFYFDGVQDSVKENEWSPPQVTHQYQS